MRFIPTRVHGMLDYLVPVAVAPLPWIFKFSDNKAATGALMAFEGGSAVYSTLTDYELGVSRKIPMPMHLNLDVIAGVLMMLSPWVLRFSNRVWLPHVLVGLTAITSGLLTQTVTSREKEDLGAEMIASS